MVVLLPAPVGAEQAEDRPGGDQEIQIVDAVNGPKRRISRTVSTAGAADPSRRNRAGRRSLTAGRLHERSPLCIVAPNRWVARWSATQGYGLRTALDEAPPIGARDSRDRECEVRRRPARGLERPADAARDPSVGRESSVAPSGHSPREPGARPIVRCLGGSGQAKRESAQGLSACRRGPSARAPGRRGGRAALVRARGSAQASTLAAEIPTLTTGRSRGLTTIPGRVIRSLVG